MVEYMNLLQKNNFKNICNTHDTWNRTVNILENGLVIEPYLFWLAGSSDGFIIKTNEELPGLIETKCPKAKRNFTPEESLKDEKFYICKNKEGKLFL